MSSAGSVAPNGAERQDRRRVLCVVGSRPSILQVAPILRAMAAHGGFAPRLVHTGERDGDASALVFGAELGLPAPDVHLGVSAASPTAGTARVLIGFETLLLAERPDLVVVAGDGHATLASALAAAKLRIPVAHVEAGLRSPGLALPEERHRMLTDRISSWLFTPSPDADQNLIAEGHPPDRIHRVGNVMIDSLLHHRARAARSSILESLALAPRSYAVLVLDRPETVDDADAERLRTALAAVAVLGAEIPVLCPVDAETRRFLPRELNSGLRLLDPHSYLDSLRLIDQASLVLTDSGGIEEETSALAVPCLTLREATERPITVSEGTNIVVGLDREKILEESRRILRGEGKRGQVPALWDGRAAERVVSVLAAAPLPPVGD
jgi:UDP-N-acetylglucosamine 2-epimerase (non-hydrolysing)